MGETQLLERLLMLVPMLLSLTVHEYAHAWSANRLGDDTAERMGRLTLNPLAHIDPIGTVLLPLLGIPFGWAKPVPINPLRFRRDVRMGTGVMLTAAAGPLSNVVLAVLTTVAFGVLVRTVAPDALTETGVGHLLTTTILMNVSLALFNLLPVPPLDGSRIVEGFLPTRLRSSWAAFARFSPFVLLATIAFAGVVLRAPMNWSISLLGRLMEWVVTVG